MNIDNGIEKLRRTLENVTIDESNTQLNEPVVHLRPEQLTQAITILHERGIQHLTTITALDVEDRIVLLYHFWHRHGLTIQVNLDREAPRIDSLTGLIPGAEFYEREIREMFGVKFAGLQNMERMFLPENWTNGPPMRKRAEEDAAGSAAIKKGKTNG